MITDFRIDISVEFERCRKEFEGIVGGEVRLESHYVPQTRQNSFTVVMNGSSTWSDRLAGFQLTPLPGNENIVVSHDSWIRYDWWGKGVGTLLNKVRMEGVGRIADAKALVCTVSNRNEAQIRLLEKNGWIRMGELYNNVRNTRYVWGCDMWMYGFDNKTREGR